MTGSTEKAKRDRGKRYLLILPCSKKKRDIAAAPAIELYNGPFYQILRKYRLPNLDVLILSAKYGLIPASKTISAYDQKMTNQRALELSGNVRRELDNVITKCQYKHILVNLGKTYMEAFCACNDVLDQCDTSYVTGPIGKRLHQLKDWLIHLQEEVNYD